MSIEEQIKNIAKEELKGEIFKIEEGIRGYLEEELEEIKSQLTDLKSRTEELEKRLDDRMNLLVRLRKYTLDSLMSEYKRLMEAVRPEKEESAENTEL